MLATKLGQWPTVAAHVLTEHAQRVARRHWIEAELRTEFAKRSLDEVVEKLAAVGVPIAPSDVVEMASEEVATEGAGSA